MTEYWTVKMRFRQNATKLPRHALLAGLPRRSDAGAGNRSGGRATPRIKTGLRDDSLSCRENLLLDVPLASLPIEPDGHAVRDAFRRARLAG